MSTTYRLVGTAQGTGSANTITFSGLTGFPATEYEVIFRVRGTSTNVGNFYVRINGNSNAVYGSSALSWSGSGNGGQYSTNLNQWGLGSVYSGNFNAGFFTYGRLFIPAVNPSGITRPMLLETNQSYSVNGVIATSTEIGNTSTTQSPISSISFVISTSNWEDTSVFRIYEINRNA